MSKRDRHEMLRKWSTEKGALGLQNVDLLAEFADDFCPSDKDFRYEGIGAKRDIPHRQAFLAIPFEMIISPDTLKQEEPELYEYVTEQAPDLFDLEEQDDAEQLLMTFFLMNEWTKGKESKWYPYLINLPKDQKFFCDWDEQVLEATQDKRIQQLAQEYKIDVDLQWQLMLRLLLKDEERFKLILDGWEPLFRRMYCLVCTRCYGYYLNYTFMCPVLDLVNHSHSFDTELIVINKELHINPL